MADYENCVEYNERSKHYEFVRFEKEWPDTIGTPRQEANRAPPKEDDEGTSTEAQAKRQSFAKQVSSWIQADSTEKRDLIHVWWQAQERGHRRRGGHVHDVKLRPVRTGNNEPSPWHVSATVVLNMT